MPGTRPTYRSQANPWLDLVRSLAIVLVLFRHGQRVANSPPLGSDWLGHVFLNGWVGVDLFFVLSGYLIAQHLLRSGLGTRHFTMRRYLVGRAMRIVPAYFAVIALVVIGAFPFFDVNQTLIVPRVIYHALFLQDYLPSNINIVFWSLGVEAKFYLIAPVLLWVLVSLRSSGTQIALLLGLAGTATALRYVDFTAIADPVSYETFFRSLRSPFHACLEPLIAGVAISLAQYRGWIKLTEHWGIVFLAGGIVALLGLLASHEFMADIGLYDAVAQPIVIAALSGVITLGAVAGKTTRLPFERGFTLVSRLSYALYLVHYPLIPFALFCSHEAGSSLLVFWTVYLSLIHISEPTRLDLASRMPSSA